MTAGSELIKQNEYLSKVSGKQSCKKRIFILEIFLTKYSTEISQKTSDTLPETEVKSYKANHFGSDANSRSLYYNTNTVNFLQEIIILMVKKVKNKMKMADEICLDNTESFQVYL